MAKKKRKKSTAFSQKMKKTVKKLDKKLTKGYQRIGQLTVIVIFIVILVLFFFKRYGDERSLQQQWNQSDSLPTINRQAFVERLVPTAQQLHQQYGVLPSVALAQAMIESNFGTSELAANYYNLFGVKTSADDPQGIDFKTQEFVNNEWVTIVDRFKVYKSWEDSLTQHASLIFHGTTWNNQQYQAVLDGKTYQEQARGLQSSGYATDPDYADKVIAMIEEWQLTQYDQ